MLMRNSRRNGKILSSVFQSDADEGQDGNFIPEDDPGG